MQPDRAAAKEEAAEDGKKKKGGITVPEEWPWEEAKKVFEQPDVTPADQIEVHRLRCHVSAIVSLITYPIGRVEEPRC